MQISDDEEKDENRKTCRESLRVSSHSKIITLIKNNRL